MNVLILNQYAPPDDAPTAVLAGELAGVLQEMGHRPVVIGSGVSYGPGHSGWRRLVREIRCWLALCVRGWQAGPVDAVVVFSSPPCALLAGLAVARLRRARLLHWAMDLYPETAVALGECPDEVGALLERWMGRAYRNCERVVALDADMADGLARRYAITATVIPPWPVPFAVPSAGTATASAQRRWMYSGNLGRAHDWETLLLAQRMLEVSGDDWELVVQGGGAGYAAARRAAEGMGLKRCRWLPYAPVEELPPRLMEADVLVATRRPTLRGLLWPSKLAFFQCLPRPILWIGETKGAVARMLEERGGSGVFGCGDARGVAEWLRALPTGEPAIRLESPRGLQEKGRKAWMDVFANALK